MMSRESAVNPEMAYRELASAPPAPWFPQFLRDELTGLSPARLSRMLRMTALVVVVTIVSMALRVPEVAISTYMIFFFSRSDVLTTVRTGMGGIVGFTLTIAFTFILFLLTLAEPALRVPAMACVTFAGMYVVRSSPAGPLGLLIGFLGAYALSLADSGLPPEALTRALLWLWVVLSYPIALLVVTEAIAGQRPADVFHEGVAERLEAAGEYLRTGQGQDVAARRRIERLQRMGTAELSPYVKDRSPLVATARARVVRQLDLLVLLLRELPADARREPKMRRVLARAGDVCLALRRAVLGEDGAPPPSADLEGPPAGSPTALAVVLPLLGCVAGLAEAVRDARQPGSPSPPNPRREERTPPASAVSAAKRQEAVRFALKVTLAAMAAYFIYSSLAWSGIHTAMITCYFVAQDSVEATIHKLTLRIVGACIGAALGIAAIVFVLPQLETVGGLVVLVAAVTLFAAWIATGSPAISYAGLQIAFAFYLTVLQGFSRTSHMVVARDRLIGILLGNLLITLVFTYLWPVGLGASMRRALSRAAEALAATLRSAPARTGREVRDAEATLHASLQAATEASRLQRAKAGDLDGSSLVPALERLFVPVHAIASQPLNVQALPPAVSVALSALADRVASWLSELARVIAGSGPVPAFQPAVSAAAELDRLLGAAPGADDAMAPVRLRLAWYRLLDDEIQRFPAHRLRPLGKDT